MRVIETSSDRLILRSRPWGLGGILIFVILLLLLIAWGTFQDEPWLGLIFLAVALAAGGLFVLFVRQVVAILDRPAKAVVIRSASLLGQTETTLPLASIKGATVEISTSVSSSGGRSRTYRPALRLKGGQPNLPLTEVYSGGPGADQVAEAINDWLGTVPNRGN
jgi:hypothetical protein